MPAEQLHTYTGIQTIKIATGGNKMKRVFFSIILLACCNIITAELYARESRNVTNTLPKKAKWQAKIYVNSGMIGVGYVYKKQFVENEEVTFFRNPYRRSSIKVKNGEFYIIARRGEEIPLSSLDVVASGIYFMKNGIAYIEGSVFSDRSVSRGTFAVSDIRVGSAPEFAKAVGLTSHRTETIDGGKIYARKQNDGTYSIRVTFPDKSNIAKLELQTDAFTIPQCNECRFNAIVANLYIERAESATVTFRNRDVFTGTITTRNSNGLRPLNGEYRYATGEVFIGEYSRFHTNGGLLVPSRGKIIYADGSVSEGDWLKEYEFTESEWSQIYDNNTSLTDIRNAAIRTNVEKQQKLREEAIREEQAKREEKLRAERVKREEELKKEQEKREKEREAERRRRGYISKYGEYYGNKIFKKELVLGMSKEMVSEVWHKNVFNHSISSAGNQITETWTFKAPTISYLVDLVGVSVPPKMMIFKNNKLTDIYR